MSYAERIVLKKHRKQQISNFNDMKAKTGPSTNYTEKNAYLEKNIEREMLYFNGKIMGDNFYGLIQQTQKVAKEAQKRKTRRLARAKTQ